MKTNKLIFQHALKIYLGIVLFFFIVKLIGLSQIVELRIFNALFVILGVNSCIKKNVFKNLDNNYLTNLSIGFAASFLAVLATSFSLIFYTMVFDSSVITFMENSRFWGNNLSLGTVVFALLAEGFASSVICTFIVMQYWKKYKLESIAWTKEHKKMRKIHSILSHFLMSLALEIKIQETYPLLNIIDLCFTCWFLKCLAGRFGMYWTHNS